MMHEGEKRIKVIIPFEQDYIERIRQVQGRWWSRSINCRYIPYNVERFYPQRGPEEIIEKEILVFLRYLVEERQVSTSYQNQSGTRSRSMPSNIITKRYWEAEESSTS